MENSEIFEKQPVSQLLWRLALPSIMAQMVNLLYNIADRIFLGRIEGEGAAVLTGLGITAPIVTIISAFANLVGTGGGPLASIAMGQKKDEEAERILGNSFIMLAVISVVLTLGLFLYGKPLLFCLGADDTTIPYALAYLRIYLLGTVFVMLSMGLNSFLITQGFNQISMRNTCIGAALNILLDPVLIYGFHLGIAGAAWATIISQGVNAVLVLQFLLGRKTKLRLRLLKPELRLVCRIAGLGISTFFMNVTEGMVQTVFYRQLLLYGNSNYVAAMSIVYSVDQFIFMPIIGLCQGAQPIISYNYGAGNAERFHRVIRLLVGTAVIFAAAAVVIIECIPKSLVSIFTTDNNVITIGTRGLRIFVLGRLPISVQLALQELFRSIGYAKTTMYNAAVRKLVLIIPLALLLPALWGLGTDGVFLSECISDVLAAGNTVIVYLLLRKRII